MKLFVEYGAELKYSWWGPDSDEFGYDTCDYEEITDATLLEMAAHAGRPDMIEFFLYAGAQVDAQSTEAYLKLAREKEPLRLEFEARHQAQEERNDWQTVKYRRLDIGPSPWLGVDANRIDENGDNLLFRLLQQEGGLKRRDKEFLRHIAPLTDLSITDRNGRTPWQIAQSRMEGGVALYLLNQAKVTASPLERCYLWG